MSAPSLLRFRQTQTTFHLEMTAQCIKCRRRMYPVSNLRHWRLYHK